MKPSASGRTRLLLGAFFSGLGLACLVLASVSPRFRLLAIASAIAVLLLAASALSTAARTASQLPLVGKSVNVEVWGSALEESGPLVVTSVRALGAGLHLFLGSPAGGRPRDLKVAQPKSVSIMAGRLEIAGAAYISWAGTKLKPNQSGPTTALVVSWSPA